MVAGGVATPPPGEIGDPAAEANADLNAAASRAIPYHPSTNPIQIAVAMEDPIATAIENRIATAIGIAESSIHQTPAATPRGR